MTRVENWPQRLFDALNQDLQFSWDVGGCVQLAILTLKACYGDDWVCPYNVGWESRDDAYVYYRSLGYQEEDIALLYDKHFEQVHPSIVTRGDIAVFQGITFVYTGSVFMGLSPIGKVFLPVRFFDRVYKI